MQGPTPRRGHFVIGGRAVQPLRANCSGGCRQRNRRALVCLQLGLLGLLVFLPVALAKDKPLVAILLFEGPSGPAYVQISELQINAKSEMLACAAGAKYDNSAYHKLIKLPLSTAVSIERDAAGVLTMKTAAGEPCVVPSNVKFEKNAQYSSKELADRALLTGRVVGKSSNAPEVIPEFK